MPLLLEFMLIITPGSTVLVLLGWLVKTKYESSVTQLRVKVVRSEAHLEDADRRALVAEGTARQALVGMNQAIESTRVIELVNDNVAGLREYLVNQIEGTASGRLYGRHARPVLPGEELSAIGAGEAEEQEERKEMRS